MTPSEVLAVLARERPGRQWAVSESRILGHANPTWYGGAVEVPGGGDCYAMASSPEELLRVLLAACCYPAREVAVAA